MKSQLWWKWLVVAFLTVTSIYLVTPLSEKLRLGLDLRGGSSMTVELDGAALREMVKDENPEASEEQIEKAVADATAAADETAVEIIRSRIDSLGTEEPVITKGKNGRIYVQMPGASAEQRARAESLIKSVAFLDFRLVSVRSAEKAARLLDRGSAPRGYKIADMGEAGQCYVRDRSVPEPDPRSLRTFGDPDPGYVFALEKDRVGASDVYRPIYIERRARMTGRSLSRAGVTHDDYGRVLVSLKFDGEGKRRFAEITRKYCAVQGGRAGRQLAIVLDGIVYSAPVLDEPITGGAAVIRGSFTLEEAQTLKNVLNAGAMPAPLKFLGKRFVNPTLGEDSIADAKVAICVGVAAVLLFMALYYRAMGVVADLALLLNFVLLPLAAVLASGLLSQFSSDATMSGGSLLRLPVLTLPGIAGILLSVGMAVDANVLIYERTREETAAGRPGWPAVMAGYQRAFSAIFDGNITTVLTGVVLFVFGTGLIRGFAVTLVAGIVASMFTALFFTRIVFQSALSEQTQWKPKMMQAVKPGVNIPFIANSRRFATLAVAVIVVTLAVTAVRGFKKPSSIFGVDFTGGARVSWSVKPATAATAQERTEGTEGTEGTASGAAPEAAAEASAEAVAEAAAEAAPEAAAEASAEAVAEAAAEAAPEAAAEAVAEDLSEEAKALAADHGALPSLAAIRAAAKAAGVDDAEPQYQFSDGGAFLEIKTVLTEIDGTEISEVLSNALSDASDPELAKGVFTYLDIDSIGSQIGSEMKSTAVKAIALSTLIMLVYIGFRFEFGFGLGAIVALVHDVLITIGIFACLGFQFNLTIVAALLTIVGYGVNDTIVLFDRVREELKRDQKSSFPDLVNRCVNQTLSRTVLTSVTTVIPVAALILFCKGDIRAFGVCMLVGIVVSTFSSVFIASPVTLAWYKGKRPAFQKN